MNSDFNYYEWFSLSLVMYLCLFVVVCLILLWLYQISLGSYLHEIFVFLSFYFQPYYVFIPQICLLQRLYIQIFFIQSDYLCPLMGAFNSFTLNVIMIYLSLNLQAYYISLLSHVFGVYFSLMCYCETSVMILKNHSTFPLSLVYWRLYSIFFLWLPCELDNVLLTHPDNSPR